jgi:hypothetical protein
MIPTAEEWLKNHNELSIYDVESHDEGGYLGVNEQALYKIMRKFAKFHVKAALEAASENALICEEEPTSESDEEGEPIVEKHFISSGYIKEEHWVEVSKESILKAYPLENIK